MKRKWIALLAALVLFAFTAVPVHALTLSLIGDNNGPSLLVDDADLLTPDERTKLLEHLTEISDRQGMDVAIYTTADIGGRDIIEFADDYFDQNGYGRGSNRDGVMLFLDMDASEYYITTAGFGTTALTDYGMEMMEGYFVPKLSAEKYYEGFVTWADLVDDYVTRAKNGEPVDLPSASQNNYVPSEEKHAPGAAAAGGAGLIGFLSALGVTGSMRKEMKSVKQQRTASQYYKNGSMHVNVARDDFLYRNVSRTPRPQHNDRDHMGGSTTHISHSGITHGGHGGKF